jgi:hypothetical protein
MNYAVSHQSSVYHIMQDERYTLCRLSASLRRSAYADTNRPTPRIVAAPQPNGRLCQHCAQRVGRGIAR